MTLRELFGRLATWRRRDAMAHELTSEVEAHVALLARDLEREGMSPADALAAARRRIGDVGRLREESRDAWGFPAIDAIVQDVRYALRGLRRAPGFTITVILTLGLGIGANVAIFAVLDRLMFRPFPLLHDPATVGRVYLRTTYRGRSNANSTFPYLRFVDLSAATRTISDIAAQNRMALRRRDRRGRCSEKDCRSHAVILPLFRRAAVARTLLRRLGGLDRHTGRRVEPPVLGDRARIGQRDWAPPHDRGCRLHDHRRRTAGFRRHRRRRAAGHLRPAHHHSREPRVMERGVVPS
jgi:hypothetical protein